MTDETEVKYPNVTVQLSGEDGNSLAIVARVRMALQKSGVGPDELAAFANQALSGDYDNVLGTVMQWVTVE